MFYGMGGYGVGVWDCSALGTLKSWCGKGKEGEGLGRGNVQQKWYINSVFPRNKGERTGFLLLGMRS